MNITRAQAALELLRFKATSQMCEGKTTCIINEEDVKEILFMAGMEIDQKYEKSLEVI